MHPNVLYVIINSLLTDYACSCGTCVSPFGSAF